MAHRAEALHQRNLAVLHLTRQVLLLKEKLALTQNRALKDHLNQTQLHLSEVVPQRPHFDQVERVLTRVVLHHLVNLAHHTNHLAIHRELKVQAHLSEVVPQRPHFDQVERVLIKAALHLHHFDQVDQVLTRVALPLLDQVRLHQEVVLLVHSEGLRKDLMEDKVVHTATKMEEAVVLKKLSILHNL
jgi:hypothetical protein